MAEENLTSILYVRLTEPEREVLRTLAKLEDRAESYIARRLIRQGLMANPYKEGLQSDFE